MRERSPREHEVDGSEAHVKIMVHLCKCGIESVSDFLSLEGARRGVDCDFSNRLAHIEDTLGFLKDGRILDKTLDFGGNQTDVGPKSLGSKTELDELHILNQHNCFVCTSCHSTYLLLLHEFGVGAIIHNIATKNGCRKRRVDFLSADVSKLAVENKFIAFCAQVNSGLFAQENESEDIAVLQCAPK